MHRVVITGMGMSTSLGPDLRTCWQRLLAGDSGITPLSFWDPSEYNTKVVAEVKNVPRDTGAEGIPAAWCRPRGHRNRSGHQRQLPRHGSHEALFPAPQAGQSGAGYGPIRPRRPAAG